MTQGDIILSAELAMGLLDGPDAARAEERLAGDSAFARMVADWEDDLVAAFASLEDHRAPPEVLDRVRARLFGVADQSAPAGFGLPWGRILGSILAAKAVVVAGVLGWNAWWTSHVQLATPFGPAVLDWHQGQDRVRLRHDSPAELHLWVDLGAGQGLVYLGREGDWITSRDARQLVAGTVLLIGPGRPAQPDEQAIRLVLGEGG